MARAAHKLLVSVGILFVAGAVWHTSDRGIARSTQLADAVLEVGSRVALSPQRSCEPRVARSEQIAEGSAPRLDADARFVWFELRDAAGRRQIARIERATRSLECLSCNEPGNNRRPAPHPTARAVLFDTDRFASRTRPFDRELMVLITDGPSRSARRLTWDAARDTHALYDPSGVGVVWSRFGFAGRAVRAPIQLGHGSLSLGRREVLARGGLAPLRPLAWSADARAFAHAGGFRFAPWAALADFASETPLKRLPAASAFDGSIAFSADGSLMARGERADAAARVWLGDARDALDEVELGELGAWGEPTGIALAPKGDAFALAQRRGPDERIVWVELACRD